MNLRMICVGEACLDGPGHLVAGQSYRVGRSSSCSFVVSDLSVSRCHAEVTVNHEKVSIKDLGSRNGTYVNGVRVKEAELLAGESVSFGGVQFHITGLLDIDSPEHENSELSTFYAANKPPALKQLSAAQRRVLDELLQGSSEKEVGTKLAISPHTVHNHVKQIYQKMGVSSRPELLALFVDPNNPDQSGK